MVSRIKKALAALVAVSAALSLFGCFRLKADDLYRLPQASEDYLKLQAQINGITSLGYELSPPLGGQNRQSVQLKDINGDGINEVVAFFTALYDSTLSVHIFQMTDGGYALADVIEGVGTAFDSVRYADLDGDGSPEIIIGRQSGASLKHLSVYSVRDFPSVQLASREYLDFLVSDINADGNDDIAVIRFPSPEAGAIVEVFTLMPDGEVVSQEARLSAGIEKVSRVFSGKLADGSPAVFVDSEGRFEGGSLVTDVCAFREGVFTGISISPASGVSDETVRSRLNSSDIDKDGVFEVPIPRLLQAQSETTYYAIDWYAFGVDGDRNLKLTTYHNTFDEWFLILPFDWRGNVSLRREDIAMGERTIVFSYIAGEEGPYVDFLKIYKISGEKREERAQFPGRVMLLAEGSAAYAFEMLVPPNSFGLTLTERLIKENFRLIYPDWLSISP